MLKNLCIWYLRMTNTAVFLNFEILEDVHVATDAKKVYTTELTSRDNGVLHLYQK